MTDSSVKRLALVLSKQAEIEGMKVENTICEHLERDLVFSNEDFKLKANDLLNLAYCHDEQL